MFHTRPLLVGLLVLLGTGCVEYEPGVSVTFVALGQISGAENAVPTADGTLATIEAAYAVIGSVEVHPCQTERASWLEQLNPFAIRSAHAHTVSTSTRRGIPTVVDLTASGLFVLGEIAPPLGKYCQLTVIISPADQDAYNPTNVSLNAGEAIRLEGHHLGAAFALVSGRELRHVATFDPPLLVDDAHRKPSLFIELDVQQWLIDTDLTGMTNEQATETMANRAERALTVRQVLN
jgi:hypothetical protein